MDFYSDSNLKRLHIGRIVIIVLASMLLLFNLYDVFVNKSLHYFSILVNGLLIIGMAIQIKNSKKNIENNSK